MKIKLEKIANSINSLRKLANVDLGTPTLNFKFMGVLSTVETEVKKYIELQKSIIEKYRDKEKKNDIIIPFESIDEFNKDMQEAGSIEIELEWETVDCRIDILKGFTANDMQASNGLFINIKGE